MNWLACGGILLLVLILLLPFFSDCYGYIVYESLPLQEKRIRYGYLLGKERDAFLEKMKKGRKRVEWLRGIKNKLERMCGVELR
jgi:hypothetical protein